MNWYKTAQNNWKITKMVSTIGMGTILALLALKGMTMPDLAEQFQQNPQQVVQEARQVQEQQEQPVTEETQPPAAEPVSQVSDELRNMIARHEGNDNTVYPDSRGIPTVGIGFNLRRDDAAERLQNVGADINEVLDGQALTDEQVNSLFQDDVRMALNDARTFLPNFNEHPEIVQDIVTDMSFNLGLTRLSQFNNFREALSRGDYQTAADEMVDSRWHGQVGNRSGELVQMMREVR